MTEARGTKPYISHLRITKRPTQVLTPTDLVDQEGNPLARRETQVPGISCEIVPYLSPEIKAPAVTYNFLQKAFYQQAKEELEAIATPNQREVDTLAAINALLADTSVTWCEDILAAGGLPNLMDLWAEVFSDALNQFPGWTEGTIQNGIPTAVREMMWDARIPFESAKSVELNVGVYLANDPNSQPTQYKLAFEDNATRTQREQYIAQLEDAIAQRTAQIAGLQAEIAAMQEGPAKEQKRQQLTQTQADKARYEQELAQRQAVTVGLISTLLSNPSVQQSMPALLMAILMTLSAKEGWNLDQATTLEELIETLTNVATA